MYGPSYFAMRADPRRARMQDQERKRLREHKTGGRILDVGCGDGAFLAGLDDRWEKWGIDISPAAVQMATDKGIRMEPYIERWPEGFADEAFDAVVFRGTLQHIDLPFYVLRECVRILRADGVMVFLATPNTGSIYYRLLGRLPALDPTRNWLLVSDAQLSDILRRLGMQVEEIVYPYWGTPYARPLRDLLDFALSLAGKKRGFAWPGNMMEVYARKHDLRLSMPSGARVRGRTRNAGTGAERLFLRPDLQEEAAGSATQLGSAPRRRAASQHQEADRHGARAARSLRQGA